ncbi:MAG: hypothetical protein AB1744_14875 [Candidatus Zixiibacteriota bacterium]
MYDPDAKYLRELILEVVENQLQDLSPPETKETFDRLMAQGIPEEEVRKLLGCVVSTEMFEIMKKKEPFNRERFVRNLQALPTLPWENEDG